VQEWSVLQASALWSSAKTQHANVPFNTKKHGRWQQLVVISVGVFEQKKKKLKRSLSDDTDTDEVHEPTP
jgi:hypothetical protein